MVPSRRGGCQYRLYGTFDLDAVLEGEELP